MAKLIVSFENFCMHFWCYQIFLVLSYDIFHHWCLWKLYLSVFRGAYSSGLFVCIILLVWLISWFKYWGYVTRVLDFSFYLYYFFRGTRCSIGDAYNVGIYRGLITDWTSSTPAIIVFPAQYRTKIEILLGKVFRKYHKLISVKYR